MSYVRFSPKQRKAMLWWLPGGVDAGHEAIVCDGAVRSGKTLAMGLGFFLWAGSGFQGGGLPCAARPSELCGAMC